MKLLKFTTQWCGPCKMQDKEFKNNPISIPVANIDIDEDMESAIKYSVASVPKIVLLDGNNKVVHTWTGFTESWIINDYIKEYGTEDKMQD